MNFRISNELRLNWVEPAHYIAAYDLKAKANCRWWRALICAIFFIALVIVFWSFCSSVLIVASWYFNKPNPHMHSLNVWWILILGLFGGIFVEYASPWAQRKFPSHIRMRASSFSKTRGGLVIFNFSYKSLRGYSFSQEENALVLKLHRKRGRAIEIGVPDQVIMHAATLLLKDASVTQLAEPSLA